MASPAIEKKRRAERKQWLADLKSKPCEDCGETSRPESMVWDRVRGSNGFRIGSHHSHYPEERVIAEIAKCELVCRRCFDLRQRIVMMKARAGDDCSLPKNITDLEQRVMLKEFHRVREVT